MLTPDQTKDAIEVSGQLLARSRRTGAIQVRIAGRVLWLPKDHSEVRGGGRFYIAGWLARKEGIDGDKVISAVRAQQDAELDQALNLRMPRHIDCILGDLSGVMERIQEGGSTQQLEQMRRLLVAEAARAETDGMSGMSGPYLPPGYTINPHWEGAAPYYDGEVEIAAESWGVPTEHPKFWEEVNRRMIEGLHPQAVETYQ